MAAIIASILFTTIFITMGAWTVGIGKTCDVERETVPWVEVKKLSLAYMSFLSSIDEIRGFIYEQG